MVDVGMIGQLVSVAGSSFQIGGAVADSIWGKDIRERRFAGNSYVGGNPALAGQFSGAYADIKANSIGETERKEPWYTRFANIIGPALQTVGDAAAGAGTTDNLSDLGKGIEKAKRGIVIKKRSRTRPGVKKAKSGLLVGEVPGSPTEGDSRSYTLNGQQVLLTPGEEIYKMNDGAVAVLNQSQQQQLAYKPLSEVVNNLPAVGPKAATGLRISGDVYDMYHPEGVDPEKIQRGATQPIFNDAGFRFRNDNYRMNAPDLPVDVGMRFREGFADGRGVHMLPPPIGFIPEGQFGDAGVRYKTGYEMVSPISVIDTGGGGGTTGGDGFSDAGMRYRNGYEMKTPVGGLSPTKDAGIRYRTGYKMFEPHVTMPEEPTTISGKRYDFGIPGKYGTDEEETQAPVATGPSFFDDYLKDLKRSRWAGIANNAAQFGTALADYLMNKKAVGPDKVSPVGAAFPIFQWLSPEIPMQALERGLVRSLKTGWEMGNRDRSSEVFTRFLAGARDIGSRYAAINAQGVMQTSQAAVQAVNTANAANADIAAKNIGMQYQWMKDKSLAMQSNKDLMSKSLYANQILNSQYYKNRLEGRIYKDMYTRNPNGFAYMFGGRGGYGAGIDPEVLAYYAQSQQQTKK